MEERTLYGFNVSQDVINLQTKYSLFNRVANILFGVAFDEGFDRDLMTRSIDKLFERHDCLRITFVKQKGGIKQYFDSERHIGKIPFKEFSTRSAFERFLGKFRKTMVNVYKGKTLEVVFVKDALGKDNVVCKISHFVADTYAIGLLVSDLVAVYNALKNGEPMPQEPGKFEDVLKKDLASRGNEEAMAKDHEFFDTYYTKTNPEHPMYCGIHGDNSDRWLKYKRKGMFSLPYLFVKCDTVGYKYIIPSAVTANAAKWCEENNIPMSSFFYACTAIAASVINGKAPRQLPLELMNCRGTLSEKRCGGTKVQALSIYTTVDYQKSFAENMAAIYENQSNLYRHTKLTYLDVEQIQHKFWNYSMVSQLTNFCYSFIPMSAPKGVTMQVYSNGKGALVCYMGLMWNVDTGEIEAVYDIQSKMVTPQAMNDFQNLLIHTVETVLARPDIPLEELF